MSIVHVIMMTGRFPHKRTDSRVTDMCIRGTTHMLSEAEQS